MGSFDPKLITLSEFVDEKGHTQKSLDELYVNKQYRYFKGSVYTCVGIGFNSETDRWMLVLLKDPNDPMCVACFWSPENFEETHESGPKRFELVT